MEYETAVFYNDKATIKDTSGIRSEVNKAISNFAVSSAIDKFGGAARYSRIVGVIDDADPTITRNTTKLVKETSQSLQMPRPTKSALIRP